MYIYVQTYVDTTEPAEGSADSKPKEVDPSAPDTEEPTASKKKKKKKKKTGSENASSSPTGMYCTYTCMYMYMYVHVHIINLMYILFNLLKLNYMVDAYTYM